VCKVDFVAVEEKEKEISNVNKTCRGITGFSRWCDKIHVVGAGNRKKLLRRNYSVLVMVKMRDISSILLKQ
jgi:hypothetical protein